MARLAERLVALPYRRFCGRTVQGHRIGRVIGVGGSGVAFGALDPQGNPVVMKLLRPMRAAYDHALIWREVAPYGRIDHPAVPSWRGIVREGRAYFIVLSRMPGATLASWLFEQRHAFAADELARVGGQVAEALAHLHAAGIAHGDVRPANILYDGARVSLVDFGMSSRIEDGSDTFRETQAADIAGFADTVIYLLYSTYDSAGRTGRRADAACGHAPCEQPSVVAAAVLPAATWRTELALHPDQRAFLEDALAALPNMDVGAAAGRFRSAFGR